MCQFSLRRAYMHVAIPESIVVFRGMLPSEEILINMMKIFREERSARNLNYEDFSAAVGVHRTTIPRYESGAVVPTVLIAIKMAHALNLTFSNVLQQAESMENDN